MTPEMKQRIEERRKALYRAVREEEPEAYRKAVEIGHLGLSVFIADENKRAAEIECAVMGLIAEIKGIRL